MQYNAAVGNEIMNIHERPISLRGLLVGTGNCGLLQMFNWKRQGPTVCTIEMLSKEEEKETIQGRPASQVLYLHDKELLLVAELFIFLIVMEAP